MKPHDSLFLLIRSLTKSERRYFTLHADRHVIGERNNYLRLFEAIAQQAEYDPAALQKLSFVKHLSSEKNYLYQMILKAMRAYHAERNPIQEIWVALQNFDFLQQKGCYADARKQLEIARSTAVKFQKIEYLPRILEAEATIIKRDTQQNMHGAIESIVTGTELAIELLVTESKLAAIYHRVFVMSRKAKELKLPETLVALDALLEKELAQPPAAYHTLRTQLYFHQSKSMIYQVRKERALAHPHFLQIAQLLEDHPHLGDHSELKYRVALSNLLVSAFTLNLWDLFPEVLAKIKNLPQLTFETEAEIFQNVAYLELIFHLNHGQFEAAEEQVPDIAKGIEKYAIRLNRARELTIIYNVGLLYFLLQKMDLAAKWFRKIDHLQPKTEHRQDIQLAARLMLLLILLDREEIDLLEYQLRSLVRGDSHRTTQGAFEKEAIDFLGKATKVGADVQLRALCATFCEQLESRKAQTNLEYQCIQEFIYWTKSKISGAPICAIALTSLEVPST
jgi:hypothetical protein